MEKQEQSLEHEIYETDDFHDIIQEAVQGQDKGKSTEGTPGAPVHRDGSLRAYYPNGAITFGPQERSLECHIGAEYALYLAHDAYHDRSDLIIHRFDTYGQLQTRGIFRQHEGTNIRKLWLSEAKNCWSATGISSLAQLIRRDLSEDESRRVTGVARGVARGNAHECKDTVDALMRITPREWEWIRRNQKERENMRKIKAGKVADVKTIRGYLRY